jgi:acyl dehydratase
MLTITGVDEAKAMVGKEIPPSEWRPVTQEDINTFAEVTGDHQFIHVDPERAAQTPFGGTIAHGYYTLSLVPQFSYATVKYDGFSFAVNYGVNKVRFPAPLMVGAKVRMHSSVTEVRDVPGGVEVHTTVTLESDRGEKPVCVAETLARLYV